MIKNMDWKVKTAIVLGGVLSWPVIRQLLDGSIEVTSAAIRIALAIVLAYGGVALVAGVIDSYLPEPEPEPEPEVEGVEDAVLVGDELLDLDDEANEGV